MNYTLCPRCGWYTAYDLLNGTSTVPHIVCPCGYDNRISFVTLNETVPKFAPENTDYSKGRMTTHKYPPICDDSVKKLALGIVLQAVADWRNLIECEVKGKLPPDQTMSFDELRGFFRSGQCELLLTDTPLTGWKILRHLEAERRDAIDGKGMATIRAEA